MNDNKVYSNSSSSVDREPRAFSPATLYWIYHYAFSLSRPGRPTVRFVRVEQINIQMPHCIESFHSQKKSPSARAAAYLALSTIGDIVLRFDRPDIGILQWMLSFVITLFLCKKNLRILLLNGKRMVSFHYHGIVSATIYGPLSTLDIKSFLRVNNLKINNGVSSVTGCSIPICNRSSKLRISQCKYRKFAVESKQHRLGLQSTSCATVPHTQRLR